MGIRIKSLVQGGADPYAVWHRSHRSKKGRKKFRFADKIKAHSKRKMEQLIIKETENG